MWKEAFVGQFEVAYYTEVCMEGSRKRTKILRIFNVQAEIRTWYLRRSGYFIRMRSVARSLFFIKHYAMKVYGEVDV
jgi:hypothetical protein